RRSRRYPALPWSSDAPAPRPAALGKSSPSTHVSATVTYRRLTQRPRKRVTAGEALEALGLGRRHLAHFSQVLRDLLGRPALFRFKLAQNNGQAAPQARQFGLGQVARAAPPAQPRQTSGRCPTADPHSVQEYHRFRSILAPPVSILVSARVTASDTR